VSARSATPWIALVLLAAAACAIEPRFVDEREPGSSGSGASSSGGAAMGVGGASGASGASQPVSFTECETDCLHQLINGPGVSCKLCHSPQLHFSQLDLVSANLGLRLRDVDATHTDAPAGSVCLPGDKLIDSARPAESWLLKKLTGQQGACGDPMPQGAPPLSAEQLACFVDYVGCVAHAPGGTSTQTHPGAGGAGTGTGGTGMGFGAMGPIAGAPPKMTSVCDASTFALPPSQAYVDNFETDARMAGWYSFADTPPPSQTPFERLMTGGAVGTAWAGHVAASAVVRPSLMGFGAGFGFGLVDPALGHCVDLSAFDGISFWIKGSVDALLKFQVVSAQTQPADVSPPGDCPSMTSPCAFQHPSRFITLTPDWQHTSIYLGKLQPPGSYAPSKVLGFDLITDGPGYEVWIDEVSFFKGQPPLGAVAPEL